MRVLFAAAEAAPLVKVGGLGDVAASLPRSLRALGHDVRLVLPGYGAIDWAGVRPQLRATVPIGHASGPQVAEIWETAIAEVPAYLVTGPPVSKGSRIYGTIDEDARQFVFFSRATLELCRSLAWRPDLLHANDWHVGAAVCWLAGPGRSDAFFRPVASLFTIHNLAYMGTGAGPALAEYGVLAPDDVPAVPNWARDAPLALAIVSADALSTVSPTYAREILTPAFGEGLDGLLRMREDRLTGILNGIDPELWNPATDPALASRYDAGSLEKRAPNKAALQEELGLERLERAPLLGVVSRLDRQKGFEIAAGPLRRWLSEGGQFVLVGTGDPAIEAQMAAIEREFPHRTRVRLRFDAPLSRRIYAGADAVLLPSRYEPCGLAQMIGMRYGALPVARRTGGLADTVRDAGERDGTGILFDDFSPVAVWDALNRARRVYSDSARWSELQRRAMARDSSWTRSADEYVRLYRRTLDYRAQADPSAAAPLRG